MINHFCYRIRSGVLCHLHLLAIPRRAGDRRQARAWPQSDPTINLDSERALHRQCLGSLMALEIFTCSESPRFLFPFVLFPNIYMKKKKIFTEIHSVHLRSSQIYSCTRIEWYSLWQRNLSSISAAHLQMTPFSRFSNLKSLGSREK